MSSELSTPNGIGTVYRTEIVRGSVFQVRDSLGVVYSRTEMVWSSVFKPRNGLEQRIPGHEQFRSSVLQDRDGLGAVQVRNSTGAVYSRSGMGQEQCTPGHMV